MFVRKTAHRLIKIAFYCLMASSLMAAEIHILPATAEDYGSGASIRSDLYYPGGIPNLGLFLGYPNSLSRKDRAVFRFDISPLLLSTDRIESVELRFYINRIVGEREETNVAIEHLPARLDILDGEAVSDPNCEEVTSISVARSDGINAPFGPNGVQPKIDPYKVDVTAAIKKDLETGQSSVVFRMRDAGAESTSNVSFSPKGVVIADGNEVIIPQLLVITKD